MRKNQGIALVTALVLMMVLVAVIAILSVDTLSEIRQNRGSLFASRARNVAESGVTYARYVMDTELTKVLQPIVNKYSTDFVSKGGDPASDYVIPEKEWGKVASELEKVLNSKYTSLPSSELAGVGNATMKYKVRNFRISTMPSTSGGQLQTYTAEYQVVSTGKAGIGRRRIQEDGFITISLGRASLSQWLFLVEDAGGDRGFFPTGTVFNGPVHANKNWGFLGQPQFLGRITASDGGAWFWDINGSCADGLGQKKFLNAGSRPPCTEPVFKKGYDWNAPRVDLPDNTLSQERAALGLDPAQDSNGDGQPDPLSDSERCAQLGINPCNGIPQGVYLPNDGSNIKGGIYIEGDVDEMVVAAGKDGTQTYEIKQGGQTYTIKVDYNNNTTTFTGPQGTTTLSGVPNGPAPQGSGGPTGQIYVKGKIDALTAPKRTGPVPSTAPDHPPPDEIPPALALETQLNITAVGEIGLYSDLVYECDPTKMGDSSYLNGNSRCASVNGQLPTVLGMLSEKDDIVIKKGAVDDIFLWGSYLSAAKGKGLAVEDYASRGPQGKMRLFGGVTSYEDKLRGIISGSGSLISGYVETFEFDTRFENSQLTPPNFPTTRAFKLSGVETARLGYREY